MSSLTLPWPSEGVISFLVQKSSGQFIFAATVIRFTGEDRKLPTSQLQLILDICQSSDASQRGTNPFALLDQLYAHTLQSSKELERVRSLLGAIFYLEGRLTPTPYFLESFLGLSTEEVALLFWDLHSIIYIPVFKSDPIRFYHASFRDFLVDRHRSEHLQIDEHAAHSLLLKSCMRHLPDASIYRAMRSTIEDYSRDFWWKHYSRGNSIKEGSLDSLLRTFKQNPDCLSFSASTPRTRLIYWWSIYGRVRSHCHGQCDSKNCTPLCHRFNSVLDQHLLLWFGESTWTKSAISLLWLSLALDNCNVRVPRKHYDYFIPEEIQWLRDFMDQERIFDNVDNFRRLLQSFLQDPKRCRHLSVCKAHSATHFAHLCARIVLNDYLSSPGHFENQRMILFLHDILLWMLPVPRKDKTTYCQHSDIDKLVIECIESQLSHPEIFANQRWRAPTGIPYRQSEESLQKIKSAPITGGRIRPSMAGSVATTTMARTLTMGSLA